MKNTILSTVVLGSILSYSSFAAAPSDTNIVAGFKLSQKTNYNFLIPLSTTNGTIIWTNDLTPFGIIVSNIGAAGATNVFVIPEALNTNNTTTNVVGSIYTSRGIASTNGYGRDTAFEGRMNFTGHFAGLTDSNFSLGTLVSGSAGIGVPFGEMELQGGYDYGYNFMTATRRPLFYVGSRNANNTPEAWYRDTWHDFPLGNKIGGSYAVGFDVYRNAEASVSTYVNSLGGSVAAATDHPTRGPEIWINQKKPFIILSTRDVGVGNNLVNCNIETVTNGVNGFQTNGYVQYFTNQGVGMAYMLEDGWLTNHRAANGMLRWNTNRFPWVTASDTLGGTNVSRYLNTNGFEMWKMMYAHCYVPALSNWVDSYHSELDIDPVNNPFLFWEYPGLGSPFGAIETQPAMTPDSIHRDISAMYAEGTRGYFMQECNNALGSGCFDQLIRTLGSASINPYKNPGQGNEIKLDAQWNLWYTTNGMPAGRDAHGMILGLFAGTAGVSWAHKYANDVNSMFVESNGSDPVIPGSGAIGWLASQLSFNAHFITNTSGFCFLSPSTDGFSPSSHTYKTWKGYFGGIAVTHANIWFTGGGASSYNYFTTAGFGLLLTNSNFVKIWQDARGIPPTCIKLNASNHIWKADLSDGSFAIWFANMGNVTTNLTVNWSQLGLPSNTVCAVSEVWTNAALGLATNSYTVAVPSVDTFLLQFSPSSKNVTTTNAAELVYNSAQSRAEIKVNQNHIVRIRGDGSVGIDTDAEVGTGLTVGPAVPVGSYALALRDSSGGTYFMLRDTNTGFLEIMGQQGKHLTGISLNSDNSGANEFARFNGGQGIMMSTNPLSSWPTAALTPGGYAIVNSNGAALYLIKSGPNSTVWTSTNEIPGTGLGESLWGTNTAGYITNKNYGWGVHVESAIFDTNEITLFGPVSGSTGFRFQPFSFHGVGFNIDSAGDGTSFGTQTSNSTNFFQIGSVRETLPFEILSDLSRVYVGTNIVFKGTMTGNGVGLTNLYDSTNHVVVEAGANITIVSNFTGGVARYTISSSGGSSTNTGNMFPFDLFYEVYYDPFGVNDNSTGPNIGGLNWTAQSAGVGGGGIANSNAVGHVGLTTLNVSSSANSIHSIFNSSSLNSKPTIPRLDTATGWTNTWIWRLNTTNSAKVFLCLENGNFTVNPATIENGIGIFVNTTNNDQVMGFCASNSVMTTTNLGTIENSTWYVTRFGSTTAGTIFYSLNDGTMAHINSNVPTNTLTPGASLLKTVTGVASSLDLDVYLGVYIRSNINSISGGGSGGGDQFWGGSLTGTITNKNYGFDVELNGGTQLFGAAGHIQWASGQGNLDTFGGAQFGNGVSISGGSGGTLSWTGIASGDGSGISNVTASAFTGDGSNVTNVWVKEVIVGSTLDTSTLASGNNWGFPSAGASASTAANGRIQLAPYGGYLSNFVAMRTNAVAAGTNIAFIIQTNTLATGASAISAMVDSSLVVTQSGAFNSCVTNTTTQSIVLPNSRFNYWTIRVVPNTALAAHLYTWSVEWWHQSP